MCESKPLRAPAGPSAHATTAKDFVAVVWAESTFVTFRNVSDVLPRGELVNVLGITYGWDDVIVVV